MAPRIRTITPLGLLMVDEGWTAHELSVASGVHARTLSNYLGGTEILDHHLVALADALDVDVDELLVYGTPV